MQERLLEFLFELGRCRGRWVLGFVILTTLAGAAVATRTRISTSQRDLVPAKHPVQKDYLAFVREFGAAIEQRPGLPVKYWDERLTSVEAGRVLRSSGIGIEKRAAAVDRLSAVILLQSYLDSLPA